MRRLASVVLTGVLLTACGGNPFSPEGVSGLYLLETVNGSPLPFSQTVTQNGVTVTTTTTAGSVSLNANGTYSVSITFSGAIGGDTPTTTLTSTDSGTFELVAPSAIRFTSSEFRLTTSDGETISTSSGGETISGTLAGDRLTIIDEGGILVFRK